MRSRAQWLLRFVALAIVGVLLAAAVLVVVVVAARKLRMAT